MSGEVATTGGALALREDQTEWTPHQRATLQAIGVEEGVSEPELTVFLHECQRRKLDPFTRQIYLIGRHDKKKDRTVYRSQTSIDGFRVIARRAADESGIDYEYEDTIWFDENSKRYEIWLNPVRPPSGAKIVVVRNGMRYDAVARFGAYVQTFRDGNPMGLWQNMPDVMIAKCAEALALRKAFPEDLGGIYTEEEMAQADNPDRVQAAAETIREERPRGNGNGARHREQQKPGGTQRMTTVPADDPRYTAPEPGPRPRVTRPEAAESDPAWLDLTGKEIDRIKSREDGEKVWAEIVAAFNDRTCTPADRKALEGMVAAKVAAAINQQEATAGDPAENEAAA